MVWSLITTEKRIKEKRSISTRSNLLTPSWSLSLPLLDCFNKWLTFRVTQKEITRLGSGGRKIRSITFPTSKLLIPKLLPKIRSSLTKISKIFPNFNKSCAKRPLKILQFWQKSLTKTLRSCVKNPKPITPRQLKPSKVLPKMYTCTIKPWKT